MTLGPIFILLAVAGEPIWGWVGKVLSTYGRVPLFYYILHLFAVHVAAIAVAAMTGQPWHWLLRGGFMHEPDGIDYGHGLGVICATWIVVVALLTGHAAGLPELRHGIRDRCCGLCEPT